VWCHTSEFTRDLLRSGIHKVLRVHHFGYPTVSFWIPVRSSVKLEPTLALRRSSKINNSNFFL
jgi:hypothetical protein